ncbi:heptahelical transmembrane protein 4-like isoform X1 [Canna indica]|uniref:Heptahelical transmembrane protein 4-like isoform X1 n=1 Tax=Canna indica TaxID=4628 RepID=A0AAQ3L0J4_9LILI|nr:heptahelical transmembrane protein 4-like isoform X1 [Canna indica]
MHFRLLGARLHPQSWKLSPSRGNGRQTSFYPPMASLLLIIADLFVAVCFSARNMALDDPANLEKPCFVDASAKSEGERCKLVEFDALPDYLKDNEFILRYYRCEWPWKETFLSFFSIHNETLNIWTHFIGFIIFICLTVLTALMIPRTENPTSSMQQYYSSASVMEINGSSKLQSEAELQIEAASSLPNWQIPGCLISYLPQRFFSLDSNLSNLLLLKSMEDVSNIMSPLMAEPVTRWPFFTFLGGAMLCLLISSLCHLLVCHSKRTAYIMLHLDYAGIAALIVTSFFPVVFYSFLCQPFYRHIYRGFITTFGVAVVAVSLVPTFQTTEFRLVRAALFFCMGLCGVVPIVHKLVVFGERPEAVLSAAYEVAMMALYGMGVAVYVARVPERWMPGRFDLVGHSHQLFHVLVVAGAYAHYLAGLVYLRWRDAEKC